MELTPASVQTNLVLSLPLPGSRERTAFYAGQQRVSYINKLPWFTHDNDASEDEWSQELIRKFGMAGYGRWWVLIENFDRHGTGDKWITSLPFIREKFRSRSEEVRKIMDFFRTSSKVLLEVTGKNWEKIVISIPKFRERNAKLKSKARSILPQDSSKTLQEEEGEGEGDKEKECRGNTATPPAAPRPPRPASRPAGAQGKTPPGPRKAPEVAPGAPEDPPKVSQGQTAAKRPQSKPSLPSRPKAGAVPEGSAHRLAAFLRNLILANDPKARVPKLISKAFQTWTREASLLFRDRSVQESVALLRWALDNEFWRANILSIPKFRKRYTQLLLNRRSDKAAEERKHPACPICQVMKPRSGHDLCTNCARCGRCGRAPEGDNLMRFTIEIRRDKTKRAICRSCSGKKSKESGHPGLTAVKTAMKEAIS